VPPLAVAQVLQPHQVHARPKLAPPQVLQEELPADLSNLQGGVETADAAARALEGL
jgi:hypothetical protein